MEMLTNLIVVTMSQYISASNKHITHLKFTQCYLAIPSLKSWVGKTKKRGGKKKDKLPLEKKIKEFLVKTVPCNQVTM